MTDNVNITAGSGTVIATDDRTAITGVAGHVQRVYDMGATSVTTGQVAPTSSAATLLAARDTRKRVIFVNQGSVDVYIGPATVTTSNGFKLPVGASVTLYITCLIQAITPAGTGNIHYLEEYD